MCTLTFTKDVEIIQCGHTVIKSTNLPFPLLLLGFSLTLDNWKTEQALSDLQKCTINGMCEL